MKSGVPPGSHLGPVLFDVFANDIGSGFLSEILLHADDLKILRSIRGFDDIAFLRHDIERLSSLFYSRSYFFFSLTILGNLCTQISEGLYLFDNAIIHLNCSFWRFGEYHHFCFTYVNVQTILFTVFNYSIQHML